MAMKASRPRRRSSGFSDMRALFEPARERLRAHGSNSTTSSNHRDCAAVPVNTLLAATGVEASRSFTAGLPSCQ